MKFGKRLAAEALRSPLFPFLDYKALKAALKEDAAALDAAGSRLAAALQAELADVDAVVRREEARLEAAAAAAAAPDALAAALAQAKELRKFALLHQVAVVKIVKKRNRRLREALDAAAAAGGAAAAAFRPLRAAAVLARCHFFASPRVGALLSRLEARRRGAAAPPAALDDDYACPICFEVVSAPVVLNCGHTFCWSCIVAHCAAIARSPLVSASPKAGAEVAPAAAAAAGLGDDEAEAAAAAVRTFGCPCCRSEQPLDPDRLVVDPELDAFLKRLAPGGEPAAAAAAAGAAPPAPAPLLPPLAPADAHKLTVCLDLDGTLVATFAPRRAPHRAGYVVGVGADLNPGGIFVVERPGLGAFLRRLRDDGRFEPVLFTAGVPDYARPIVDALEARHGGGGAPLFAHRLYRAACVPAPHYPCVKDLAALGRAPGRVVLVDDTPLAFSAQPDAGIPVLGFRGADADDRLLEEAVAPLLDALARRADVRPALAARFSMRAWFAAQGLAAPAPAPAAAAAARPPRPPPAAPAAAAAGGPAARQAAAGAARRAGAPLLALDFDRTLTDYDAAERLCDALAPELTALLAALEMPACFVPQTNAVLAEIARRGLGRAPLIAELRRMGGELPRGSAQLLRRAANAGAHVAVISDANTTFVDEVLGAAGVRECVGTLVTNAAAWHAAASPAAAAALGGGGGGAAPAAAAHALRVAPRHDEAARGPHGCALCPANLCKGAELDALRAAGGHGRVVYAGDGANDLCAALRLGPGDVVLAREGHALAALLAAAAAGKGAAPAPRARVLLWRNHDELATLAAREAAL